jgi:hypothetical protein
VRCQDLLRDKAGQSRLGRFADESSCLALWQNERAEAPSTSSGYSLRQAQDAPFDRLRLLPPRGCMKNARTHPGTPASPHFAPCLGHKMGPDSRSDADLGASAPLSRIRSDLHTVRDRLGSGFSRAALASYQRLGMDNSPRLKPASQLSLFDLSNHPGRIPHHDGICWNTPGDDCPCAHHGIPAYPHPW